MIWARFGLTGWQGLAATPQCMNDGGAERIERVVDGAAAAVLAASSAWCAVILSRGPIEAVMIAGVALGAGLLLLRAVRPEERHFALRDFVSPDAPECEGDHGAFAGAELSEGEHDIAESDAGAELLLDDVLAEITPNSRVVRLFDAAAMPTPAELRARIERHLGSGRAPVAPLDAAGPDASEALHEALAELRRSLR
ncbi:hypothetical protein [Sphingomonas sp.]|uniref:hypothetical protein n=1 Tax=Sphingomonas sp. TaxID=28214 RepID=UPI0025EB080C|nr:hypothetical protein [Sphingomonas sp.]MBV9527781.1 hypothetical protein [Sphingomonas sp.]